MKRFYDYVIYFLLYAIIGWLYEVFLEVLIYRWGYSDRGVLLGPYLPIYGVGAMVFLLLFYRLIKDKSFRETYRMIPLIFLGTMLAATAIELVASYILEWTTGSWPWQTYVDYAVNFQGRIALSPSIRFGLGGVLFLYVLQPFFDKLTRLLPERIKKPLAILLLGIFLADVVYFVASLML